MSTPYSSILTRHMLTVDRNLVPGGWFEVVDASVSCYSDDGTLRAASLLANSGDLWKKAAANAGKPLDCIDKSKSRIEAAGFTNIHEKLYKVPLGDWAKNPVLKEAGRFCKMQMLDGMEGVSYILSSVVEDIEVEL